MKKLLVVLIIVASTLSAAYSQCTKPTSVTIAGPAAVTICEGTAVTFSGSATVTIASQNGGFTYSWRKVLPNPGVSLIPPTAIEIPANTSTNIPDFDVLSGVLTDAGTYVLRVEDGNSGNTSCYTEATVVLTVNPKPTITSAATAIACSGVAQNYLITSTAASTYTWMRPAVTGISSSAATNITSTITETLINAIIVPVNVVYKITPTSTSNCVGQTFDYTVTVPPKPIITSPVTATACSGVAQNYLITSNVTASHTWTRAAVTGISNSARISISSTITEALINTTNAPVNVIYKITPTSSKDNCVGATFDYTVTVYPTAIITSSPTSTVCSGVSQNYLITSNIPASYTWTRAVVVNITPATTGTGTTTSITEAFTSTSSPAVPIDVIYTITPTSTTGNCPGFPFTYTATINPKPVITSVATGAACTGEALNYLITSDVPSTYSWGRAAVSGITPLPGGLSSANPITETLNGASTINVDYTITPTSTTGSCVGAPFQYTVTVNQTAVPTVAITPTPSTTICAGTPVTFKATTTNGGTPTYKWTSSTKPDIISTTDTYTSSSLTDGEVISVTITSSLGCAVPKNATASVTMTVAPNAMPSIVLQTDRTSMCEDDQVTFTAIPTNGGTAPVYVWRNNNAVLAGSAATFTTTGTLLGSPNSVTVEMISNALCAPTASVASNTVVTTVNTTLIPTVTISSNINTICAGMPVTFTATPTNEGIAPSYRWVINGGPAMITTVPTFTTSALTESTDIVTVELTSNALCASPTKVLSNGTSKTILRGLYAGTIGSPQTICYGATPNPITELTAAADVTSAVVYTWESSTTGTLYTPIPAIGTGFSPPALTATTWYRRVATDATLPTPCNTATSSAVKINVLPQVIAGTIGTDKITCKGSATETMSEITPPTGGTGLFTYQWQLNFSGSFVNLVGATNNTFNAGNLTATTSYRRVETSGICASVHSNIITKTVSEPEVVSAVIDNIPSQICTGGAPLVFTSTAATTGTGTLSYQWYMGNIPVGTNSATYAYAPVLISDNGKKITVVVTTSTACNTGPTTSQPVILTIDLCGAFSTSINGPNPITPGQQNAVYSVFNQTGFSYAWDITGGTIVGGQNSNSVTVDWDAPAAASAVSRIATPAYSISVTETNTSNQKKTTTLDINPTATSLAKSLSQSGITLFPNPTAESFNVEMPESGIAVSYEILDLTGVSVAQGNFISTSTAEKITTNFGAGMYQVVLRYNDVVSCGRLSKVQ